jgi:type I restriction enzyme, S subunit
MGWERVRLSELLTNRDLRFKPKDKELAGLKRIAKIDFNGIIHVSEKPSNTDMILVKNGDLVISGINVEKGAMAIYNGTEDVTATIHYSSYTVREQKIDIEFLQSYLKSPEFIQAIKEQVPGGIKTEIKPKHLLPLIIEIPTSLNEQRSLVTALKSKNDKVNAIIAENNHQLNFLKDFRQQILQDAVQGKLVPQDPNDEPTSLLLEKIQAEKAQLIHNKKIKKEKPLPAIKPEEIPFAIPESWVWCRLGEIIMSAKDGPHFSPQYVSHGIPFISTRNISPFGIDFASAKYISEEYHSQISKRCKPEKGDLLYTKGGTTGIATVNTSDLDFNVWVHVAVLKMTQLVNPFFLKHCLNSPHCYKQSQVLTRGISNQDLGLTRMVTITVPLPPLLEQQRIAAKVDQLLTLCNDLEQTIRQNQTYTQQLLQVALKEALEPGK